MEQDKLAAIQTRIAALERPTTVGSAQAVAASEIVILLDRIAGALDKIAEHGPLTWVTLLVSLSIAWEGLPKPSLTDRTAPLLGSRSQCLREGDDIPLSARLLSRRAQTLHLSAPEKQWLKAFLMTLMGDPIPQEYLLDLHNP